MKNFLTLQRSIKITISSFSSGSFLCLAISYSLVCGLQCHNNTCGYKPVKITAFVIISDLRAVHSFFFFFFFNGFGLCQTICVVSGRIRGDHWNNSFGFHVMLHWGQFWLLLSSACLRSPGFSFIQTSTVSAGLLMSIVRSSTLTSSPNDSSHLISPQKHCYTGIGD